MTAKKSTSAHGRRVVSAVSPPPSPATELTRFEGPPGFEGPFESIVASATKPRSEQ